MHSWISAGAGEQPFLDHLLHEPEIAGIEDLQFRLHAQVAQDAGALAAVVRGRDVGAVAVAEVEACRSRASQCRAGTSPSWHRSMTCRMRSSWLTKSLPGAGVSLRPVLADADVAAHAAGEVDDDVDLALADALDHLAVVLGLHAEGAGLGVAHVDVHDGRAGARRLDGGVGDLLGGDRRSAGSW